MYFIYGVCGGAGDGRDEVFVDKLWKRMKFETFDGPRRKSLGSTPKLVKLIASGGYPFFLASGFFLFLFAGDVYGPKKSIHAHT